MNKQKNDGPVPEPCEPGPSVSKLCGKQFKLKGAVNELGDCLFGTWGPTREAHLMSINILFSGDKKSA